MKPVCFLLAITWAGLWLTPDQQGQRFFNREEYPKAAEAYVDPMRRGVAWYRAGEYKKAAESFGRLSTPEARYNLGNSQLMLGDYDSAIASYGKALQDRPDWKAAEENRDLARARGELVKGEGGDNGDQTLGADQVVFDKDKNRDGQETQVAGDQVTSDAAVQAIWLRQVQTKPADFLKAKFAYQQAQASEGGDP